MSACILKPQQLLVLAKVRPGPFYMCAVHSSHSHFASGLMEDLFLQVYVVVCALTSCSQHQLVADTVQCKAVSLHAVYSACESFLKKAFPLCPTMALTVAAFRGRTCLPYTEDSIAYIEQANAHI